MGSSTSYTYCMADAAHASPLVAARMRAGGGRTLETHEFDLCACERDLLVSRVDRLSSGSGVAERDAMRIAIIQVAAVRIEASQGRALTDEQMDQCTDDVRAMRSAITSKASSDERFHERHARLRAEVDASVERLNLATTLDATLPEGGKRDKPRL